MLRVLPIIKKFLFIDAGGMTQDELDAQIENYTIRTDSPFANYQMVLKNQDGYLVFNHVAPQNYSASTDMTTANHNNIILGSHRLYENFVNRNTSEVYGLASGQ